MEESSVQPTPATETPTSVTTEPTTAPVTAAPVETVPAATAPDWSSLLEKVDPKDLRKHPRIAGIIGSAMQQERELIQREASESAIRQTREEREEELVRLFDENEETLRERYPRAYEALQGVGTARTQRQTEEQLAGVRADMAKQVGAAFAAIPEFGEFSDAERESLFRVVGERIQAGKPEEVTGAFAAKAADLIAERRSKARFEKFKAQELNREREAIRKEIAAEFLKTSSAPDLARGRVTTPTSEMQRIIQNGSDEEFAKFYEQIYGQ